MTDVKTYLDKVRNEETVRIVLLQMAHAIHQLHQKGLCHVDIRIENFRIVKSKKKIEILSASAQEDLRGLKTLFKNVLNEKGLNDNISEDLFIQMEKPNFTSENVLQHPYFWETDKKLKFLTLIARSSEEKKENNDEPSLVSFELKHSRGVFSDMDGWRSRLSLMVEEEREVYEKCLQKYQKPAEEKVKCSKIKPRKYSKEVSDTMITCAETYEKQNLLTLIIFIRDQWNRKKDLFDSSEEYWEFFTQRYPNLLPVVYGILKNVRKQLSNQGDYKDYFDTMAQISDLPLSKK